MRVLLVLALLLVIGGCANRQEERAAQLYDLVEYHLGKQNYDKAIEILQRITIDYANTDIARRAEGEISEYQNLKQITMGSQWRTLETSFASLGVALENYKTRYQAYPLVVERLNKLPEEMVPETQDPWGNPIYYKPLYSMPNTPRRLPDNYVLGSFGADGLPGGVDQNKDFFYQNGELRERIDMN